MEIDDLGKVNVPVIVRKVAEKVIQNFSGLVLAIFRRVAHKILVSVALVKVRHARTLREDVTEDSRNSILFVVNVKKIHANFRLPGGVSDAQNASRWLALVSCLGAFGSTGVLAVHGCTGVLPDFLGPSIN